MRFETSENLPKYFRSIHDLNPLTKEEEYQLAAKIKLGDQAALHTLVKHNLKIVVTLANRHIGQGVALDDLIQEGNIGLWEAATRFDPSEGTRFVSYASLWIRKRLNEAVVAYGRIVKLPHNQEYDIYKAKMAGEEVVTQTKVAIDKPVGDDDETTLGDLILNCSPEIELAFEQDHIRYTVRYAMKQLKDRDREIISAYFGLGDFEPMPTESIAERFDLTSARVSQIVKSTLTKLKENIINE